MIDTNGNIAIMTNVNIASKEKESSIPPISKTGARIPNLCMIAAALYILYVSVVILEISDGFENVSISCYDKFSIAKNKSLLKVSTARDAIYSELLFAVTLSIQPNKAMSTMSPPFK